jgi:hypothetical protein
METQPDSLARAGHVPAMGKLKNFKNPHFSASLLTCISQLA